MSGWWRRAQCTVSFAPSPVCSPWSMYLTIFVAICQRPCFCIQWPQREWSTRSFHVPEHVGFITVAPLLPDPTPRSSAVASRTSGWTPCCCVIPIPCSFFFFNATAGWNRTAAKQNKLMSQIWVHSEHTVQPGSFTLLPIQRTLIWSVWGMKTHVRTKWGSVLY